MRHLALETGILASIQFWDSGILASIQNWDSRILASIGHSLKAWYIGPSPTSLAPPEACHGQSAAVVLACAARCCSWCA
jgi:hypothetical protein